MFLSMSKAEQQAVLLLAALILGIGFFSSRQEAERSREKEGFSTLGLRYVQVAGCSLERPGLYTFYGDPTIREVIRQAGGLKKDLRLSPQLLDRKVVNATKVLIEELPDKTVRAAFSPFGASERILLGLPLPLNAATAEDLELVPGLGPGLARRIVKWREDNGLFGSVDDLKLVVGIGESTVDKLASYVAVE